VGDGVRVREGDVVGVSEGVDVGEPVMELEPVGDSDGLELGVMVTLGVRDRVGVTDTVTARTAQHNTWGRNGVRMEDGEGAWQQNSNMGSLGQGGREVPGEL
jgi:hypothetical protein